MDDNVIAATGAAPPVDRVPKGRVPTESVGLRFILPFGLAYIGYWMAYLTPPVVAMSVYLTGILPDTSERVGALALILGVAGVVGVVVNPLAGRLSDRTTASLGMRKPWMLGGVVVALIGLSITATTTAIPMILLGWCIATVGLQATIATLITLLPDQVPAHQRGKVAGILGAGIPVGATAGAFVAQAFTRQPVLLFLAPAALLVIGVAILMFSYRDRQLSRTDKLELPRLGVRQFAGSYWVSPRRHPDFAWTWLSRFLVFMAAGVLATYSTFYLVGQLRIPLDAVAGIVASALLLHYAVVLVASPIAGWLSDRTQRRKVFIGVSAAIYAAGFACIALAGSLTVFLIGMAVTGIGEGVYLAVDLALVADVLPNPDEAAKEMGLFNVANGLPPALAPAIAPALLAVPFLARGDGGNFVVLFGAAALFALLGAFAIRPVRAVH